MKDLNKIRMMSKRLVEGVQEEGINLALLYIPGLSRYHIGKLVGAGYGDVNSLRDASEVELGQLLPKRLVMRIQKKMKEDNNQQKMLKAKWIVQGEKLKTYKKVSEECGISIGERQLTAASPVTLLEPVLEISQRRPDRIIFEGKEAKITARGFSLLYFLAQRKQEVVSYDSILDEIWKDDDDAIYTRIISYIYKFRRNILDTIGHNESNKEKVKDIFKVISGRGIMLNINDKELQIS
ncbi:MAG: winged helix-turn-helix domain-containing protein [Atribacterota bacterium]